MGEQEKLCEAVENGTLADMQKWVKNGATVDGQRRDGWTPLTAFWSLCYTTPHTPLAWAAWRCRGADGAAKIDYLIANGADPNRPGGGGITALRQAAAKGDERGVAALLAGGADPRTRDKWGRTALDRALERGRKGAAALLVRATHTHTPRGRAAAALLAHRGAHARAYN